MVFKKEKLKKCKITIVKHIKTEKYFISKTSYLALRNIQGGLAGITNKPNFNNNKYPFMCELHLYLAANIDIQIILNNIK